MLLRVTVFMRCSKKLRRCLGTVTHTGVAKIRRLEHKLVNKSSAPAAAPAATRRGARRRCGDKRCSAGDGQGAGERPANHGRWQVYG